MKIQLRNIHTGQLVSYEDYDIVICAGDNDDHVVLDQYLPDHIDPKLELAE